MRFDVHLRAGMRERLDSLANQMRQWEIAPRIDEAEAVRILSAIRSFNHTTGPRDLVIAGADGTGEFPALSYGDSFVHVALAQATRYRADAISGLKEDAPISEPVVEFVWLPEDDTERTLRLDAAFAALAGTAIETVIEGSDYRRIKARLSGRANTVTALRQGLIRPHAADAGNLAIQLRSTAELGATLRALSAGEQLDYFLIDGTFSLPFVDRAENSLFHEHLKRLCCIEAGRRGTGLFALSKSHGLPSIEIIEDLAREALGLDRTSVAEHWYLRVPTPELDGWDLSLTRGRRLPPPGAATYLLRLHRTVPVLRLDMDVEYWKQRIRGATEEETRSNERRAFENLDYASHDQRCYGYPYPVKAAHDRASLTRPERVALRKQIVDAAVRAGMKRSLFRDAAIATGHE